MNQSQRKQIPVLAKNRRKLVSPLFHTQTKTEDCKYLSQEVIKGVKKTGVLNLHGKHLSSGKLHTLFYLFQDYVHLNRS